MIKTMFTVLSLALMVPMAGLAVAANKVPRSESAAMQLQDVWLTQSQAQRLLISVDAITQYIKELDGQNRAPRPGAQPCDPAYPGCCAVDLTAVMECLCQIKLQLMCICEDIQSLTEDLASCCEAIESVTDGFGSCCETIESMNDVLGECTDISTCLDSIVDKDDIDALCLSVVSLLKTILLELRGQPGCLPPV